MATAGNLRMTRQRKAILNALREAQTHPTADEVYECVRREIPSISLGTVYRNLSILSQSGLANQLDQGPGPGRFDGDLSPHYHVRCLTCTRVDDARIESLAHLEETVAELTEHDVRGHRMEFVGLCPRCQGMGAPPRNITKPGNRAGG